MKTSQFEPRKMSSFIKNAVIYVFAVVLFSSPTGTMGQAKTSTPKKAVAKRGYLRNLQPSGLRFAPPPKPPVASLPPLPITFDPQPVFSPEFAQPGSKFPVEPNVKISTTTPGDPVSVPITDLASVFRGPKQGKIPTDTGNLGAVSPQMLVRFFENGKPKTVEIPIDNMIKNPAAFRVPVRSSATYEVK